MTLPPLVSLVCRPGMAYPEGAHGYSPDQAYPEYPWPDRIAPSPNPVYAAVREVFAQAGLDRERFGTAGWNPLGGWIAPGSRVFVLCNFVYHRKPLESPAEFLGKCTHGSVVRALIDYALIATGLGGRVEFGNAPVQSAVWERVLEETGAAAVRDFYGDVRAPVEPRDLRLYVAPRTLAGGVVNPEHRPADDVAEVDLGADSLLAELDGHGARYRVADYDPRRTEGYHAGGRHVYAVNRHVLEADVVISAPKLKTHEKVGITCGVKGFVGAIALKDCLAHHRMGSPGEGGDEYPRPRVFPGAVSRFHEWVQRRAPGGAGMNALRVVDRTLRRVAVRSGSVVGGAWHGNDTAWRMAVDIARILRFAGRDGVLGEAPARRHLLLVDGVVGGEGEGPLAPSPVESGALLFSDDVPTGDRIAAELMGFRPDRLAIVQQAFRRDLRFPATDAGAESAILCLNGRPAEIEAVRRCGVRAFRPPRGWRGQLERVPGGAA